VPSSARRWGLEPWYTWQHVLLFALDSCLYVGVLHPKNCKGRSEDLDVHEGLDKLAIVVDL
jgi:hypothetical protein